MKIAIIGSRGVGSYYGGIERMLDQVCPRLLSLGHTIDVYGRHGDTCDTIPGLRSMPMRSFGGKHLENLSRSTLAALRAAGRYDVLHFHAIGPGLLSAFTRMVGQPAVVTVHALDYRRTKSA